MKALSLLTTLLVTVSAFADQPSIDGKSLIYCDFFNPQGDLYMDIYIKPIDEEKGIYTDLTFGVFFKGDSIGFPEYVWNYETYAPPAEKSQGFVLSKDDKTIDIQLPASADLSTIVLKKYNGVVAQFELPFKMNLSPNASVAGTFTCYDSEDPGDNF